MHGDIRATNIMVKRNGASGIMSIDSDWADPIGDVRYPMSVNTAEVMWPSGAYDGELITAEHDMIMVHCIFRA